MSNTGLDLSSLTPEELQTLMELLQGAIAPGAYGGNYGPSMDQPGLDLAGYNTVDIPTRNAKGNVEPFELSQAQGRFNLAQDQTSYMDNPMLAAMSGLGGIGPDAFTPTYDYGEPLNMAGNKKARHYIDTGGYKGFIADAILNQGMGPDEAVAKAIELANKTDVSMLGLEDQKLVKSLQQSLPLAKGGGKGQLTVDDQGQLTTGAAVKPGEVEPGIPIPGGRTRSAYDEDKVLGEATKMFDDIAADPAFAYEDKATGNFYSKTPEQAMIKTPFMQAFDKAGIPYLTDQYTDQKYVDRAAQGLTGRGPEEQQQVQSDWEKQLQQLQDEQSQRVTAEQQQVGQLGDIDKMLAAYQQRLTETQPLRQPPRGPQQPSMAEMMTLPQQQQQQQPQPMDQSSILDQMFGVQQPIPPLGVGTIEAMGGQSPPTTPLRQPPRGLPTPVGNDQAKRFGQRSAAEPQGLQPGMIYVDKDGNIVNPLQTAGGVRSLHDTAQAKGLTQRAPTTTDRDKLQRQIETNRQQQAAYNKQRSDMLAKDPSLDAFGAFVRAQMLRQAGRTPTRDALMQRNLALRAMGYPGASG
jgi:hypothetical protein